MNLAFLFFDTEMIALAPKERRSKIRLVNLRCDNHMHQQNTSRKNSSRQRSHLVQQTNSPMITNDFFSATPVVKNFSDIPV
jgi:hypothetical protein